MLATEIINAVAETCRTFQKTDSAYRFGGDEFVIALPGVEQSQAVKFAEYLCDCFTGTATTWLPFVATVSITGVASIGY